MSPKPDETARIDAIGWHIRLRDGVAEDWEAFTQWLEADPAHNAAYDAVVAEDFVLDTAFHAAGTPSPISIAANDDAPGDNDDDARPAHSSARRWMVTLAALAALFVATLLAWPMLAPSSTVYPVETRPGETRMIALSDGGEIALNGGTRVMLDRANPRYAALESGEARFRIVHDAANPFTLHLGDRQLVDVGTVFNVMRNDGGVLVEVQEGAVRYDPATAAIDLKAGQTLRAPADGKPAVVGSKPTELIGTWREGRLSYRNATIAAVAQDLSRSIGLPVAVAPEIAGQHFTGTIQLDTDRTRLIQTVGALLAVDARQVDSGWRLSAANRASR